MLDDCNNCLCPGTAVDEVATEELTQEKALKENELERRRLITDLEKCGVSFPVSEFEMMAHRKLIAEYSDPASDPDVECDGDATVSAENLTDADYATSMPEDMKDMLRRYYQLEAEREELQRLAGMSTAPNSVDGDEENQPFSLRRVSTPRAPFWYFRRRSVAIVENEGAGVYEAQERSGKSRHAWIADEEGDEHSQASRVTVVYPKERARKIRLGLLACCLVMLALAGVTVYYGLDFNENGNEEIVDINEEVTQPPDEISSSTSAQTAPPTAQPTVTPCIDEISITGSCFVRSEPFGVRFKNCNPCKFKTKHVCFVDTLAIHLMLTYFLLILSRYFQYPMTGWHCTEPMRTPRLSTRILSIGCTAAVTSNAVALFSRAFTRFNRSRLVPMKSTSFETRKLNLSSRMLVRRNSP